MAQMRLALAQINPTVGDLSGNARAIRAWAERAAKAGAHLVAFPEMMLTGYPVEDLALHSSFVQASRMALAELATALDSDGHGDLPVVVGYLDQAPYSLSEAERPLPQNCAAVLH
jgi:NAD+ synthase (glutamine-hydrolysing)